MRRGNLSQSLSTGRGFLFSSAPDRWILQILFRLLWSGAAILLFSGCRANLDWITYRGLDGAGYTTNAIYPPLGQKWKILLNEEPARSESFNPPIVIDNTLYFGSDDKNFYAFDLDSGYMNWIFKTKGKVNSVPFADEKSVYFGSNDGRLYAVDRITGKEKWNFQTYNTVQSLVLKADETIIFTSDTGSTYFLDEAGKQKYPPLPNPVWSHHTFQVHDGVIYWAPQGRRFGAFRIKDRKWLWMVNTESAYMIWYSFPAIADGRLFFGSNFFNQRGSMLNFYALDQESGQNIWTMHDDMDPGENTRADRNTLFFKHVPLLDYMAPSIYKDIVIFTSGDSAVRAFRQSDGAIVWQKRFAAPTSSAPTIAGDRIYFGLSAVPGREARLVCLSAKTGEQLWELEVEGAPLNAPVISGRHIIYGTASNHFYVLEEVF
jgi:outer membrane protein assembly factor BamB